MRYRAICALSGAATLALAGPASADVIYANGSGPIVYGGIDVAGSDFGWAPFTVTSDWETTSVEVTLEAGNSSPPTAIDWGLSKLGAVDVGSTPVTVVGTPVALIHNQSAYDVTFDVNLALTPGVWYLTVGNAIASPAPEVSWADNNGPSHTSYFIEGFGFGTANSGTAFTVFGTPLKTGGPGNAAPEPATWMLMILGFGAVGGALRRRREVF
ncbi:MAG TPA: PEPxxWA-CTERM sorting domain-containing protein [Caulobacteraceae bacterium]|jgi:hypothetical protein|nr:PEPxxWA-CTERM sorting domain-containing protein [Caulobacteraceae bacterium]